MARDSWCDCCTMACRNKPLLSWEDHDTLGSVREITHQLLCLLSYASLIQTCKRGSI